jgi:hypothetical protein
MVSFTVALLTLEKALKCYLELIIRLNFATGKYKLKKLEIVTGFNNLFELSLISTSICTLKALQQKIRRKNCFICALYSQ